jgi:hypothetical protein
MEKNIALYIPSKDGNGKLIDEKKRAVILSKVENDFLKRFERVTETEAVGLWKSHSGLITRERITIVRSYYDIQYNDTVRKGVKKVAEMVKTMLNQDCVSLEQNGDLEFV